MFKTYYQLTKPGIIYGNAITAAAGFLLASKGHVDIKLFLAALIGLSFIIASGCVFNNYLDRDIDAKMQRTKNRAIVRGAVSKKGAIIFGALLLVLGCAVLSLFTNHYSLSAALTGFLVYVFIYTPLKRRTVYGTLIGAIAGATPPVVGYTAVTNRFDSGALILFLILVCWQMPHFYAIAIYRLKDYAAASIPVLPVKQGIKTAKMHMLLYVAAFIFAAASLTYFGFTGYVYLGVMLLLGLFWLWMALKGFKVTDNTLWAKKMFRFSLVVITLLCVIIPIDVMLTNIR